MLIEPKPDSDRTAFHLARLKAMPNNSCLPPPPRTLSVSKFLDIECLVSVSLCVLLGMEDFNKLLNDHGMRPYKDICPFTPHGTGYQGVPGSPRLEPKPCISTGKCNRFIRVGVVLPDQPLKNIIEAAVEHIAHVSDV